MRLLVLLLFLALPAVEHAAGQQNGSQRLLVSYMTQDVCDTMRTMIPAMGPCLPNVTVGVPKTDPDVRGFEVMVSLTTKDTPVTLVQLVQQNPGAPYTYCFFYPPKYARLLSVSVVPLYANGGEIRWEQE